MTVLDAVDLSDPVESDLDVLDSVELSDPGESDLDEFDLGALDQV